MTEDIGYHIQSYWHVTAERIAMTMLTLASISKQISQRLKTKA